MLDFGFVLAQQNRPSVFGTNTSYTFDSRGNIMTKSIEHTEDYEYAFTQYGTDYTISGIGTHEYLYAYDKNNHLITETEHITGSGDDYTGILEITKQNEYDNNGNLLKTKTGGQVDEKVVEYKYNELNQLTEYIADNNPPVLYNYDASGQRISKIQNNITTSYYWDRGYITYETSQAGAKERFTDATGIFAERNLSSNSLNYLLKNGHGDVTGILNNGELTQTYSYDAYGVQTNQNVNDRQGDGSIVQLF